MEFYAVIHTKFCIPTLIFPWPNKQTSYMCIRMAFSNRISGASIRFRHSMITIVVLTKNKERSYTSFINGATFSELKFDLQIRGRLGSISRIDGGMHWWWERGEKDEMRPD